MTKTKNNKKEIIFCFLCFIIITIVTFTILEIILRILGIGYSCAPLESDPILHHSHPKNYVYMFDWPGSECTNHLVKYDSDGLPVNTYETQNITITNAKYRVAILGDSFAEGTYISYNTSFAGRLKEQTKGISIVKNYGTSSYCPILYLLQWKYIVKSFHPTHVFLLLYSNDVGDDTRYTKKAIFREGDVVAVPGASNDFITKTLRKSYVSRFFRNLYLKLNYIFTNNNANKVVTGKYIEESPNISQLTSKYLLQLAKEVKLSGAKLVISAVPSKYCVQSYEPNYCKLEFSNKVKQWALVNNIEFLDLVPVFQRASKTEKLFYKNDFHFNEKGHFLVYKSMIKLYPEILTVRRL